MDEKIRKIKEEFEEEKQFIEQEWIDKIDDLFFYIKELEDTLKKGCCNAICFTEKLQTDKKVKELEDVLINQMTAVGELKIYLNNAKVKIKELEENIPDPEWCCEHHKASLVSRIEELVEGIKVAIPCLEDWIAFLESVGGACPTAGFGEVNRKDREALAILEKLIEKEKATTPPPIPQRRR